MALKPGRLNEPYEAECIAGDYRSAILEDFTEQDLEFFADILWILKSPKTSNF